jgi:hypothetical protein
MKVIGYLLILAGGVLGLVGISIAMKPSVMPLATVTGALAIPALLIWWGVILVKKKDSKK